MYSLPLTWHIKKNTFYTTIQCIIPVCRNLVLYLAASIYPFYPFSIYLQMVVSSHLFTHSIYSLSIYGWLYPSIYLSSNELSYFFSPRSSNSSPTVQFIFTWLHLYWSPPSSIYWFPPIYIYLSPFSSVYWSPPNSVYRSPPSSKYQSPPSFIYWYPPWSAYWA